MQKYKNVSQNQNYRVQTCVKDFKKIEDYKGPYRSF